LLIYFTSNDKNYLVTTLGTLAVAIQRLLPSLNRCYTYFATISSSMGSLINLFDFLSLPRYEKSKKLDIRSLKIKKNGSIKFNDVYFKYPNTDKYVIQSMNLEIPFGSTLGIVGKTGDGKSTFLDLILGFISPIKGEIFVGNMNLKNNDNLNIWRNSIAHVPQEIYLSDNSIATNIAMTYKEKNIDYEKLRYAAKIACIDDFIESSKYGYETNVGEKGILLSGGQRQRIGIARAIYKSTKILIFDEATSALDPKTEIEVMQAIRSISDDITIIIVSHNPNSIKDCDKLIRINKGRLSMSN